MTDKQDAPAEGFALPGWQVLEVVGVDATAFLQAQTMNDLRPLEVGQWQWNGWLNPKGRLIALFALAAMDAQRWWLIVPDLPAADLAERLRRFVFRAKVKLRVREDLVARGVFDVHAHAQGAAFHRTVEGEHECVSLDMGDGHTPRTLCIGSREAGPAAPVAMGEDGAQRWAAFDLAHGLPRLSADQVESWTPQMLSLERLRAFSVKKGCYPGQEIVARTHFLGQTKRALARVTADGLRPGTEVLAGDRALGHIVTACGAEGLAVLAADRATDTWTCAGMPCRQQPLLEGLAR